MKELDYYMKHGAKADLVSDSVKEMNFWKKFMVYEKTLQIRASWIGQ